MDEERESANLQEFLRAEEKWGHLCNLIDTLGASYLINLLRICAAASVAGGVGYAPTPCTAATGVTSQRNSGIIKYGCKKIRPMPFLHQKWTSLNKQFSTPLI